jgi:signal recognition particle receptor subunit beta
MNYQARFEQALRSREPVDALIAIVKELVRQGQSKEQVRELLSQFLTHLQENAEPREADEDAVMDVLDFVDGWCSPHAKLFP